MHNMKVNRVAVLEFPTCLWALWPPRKTGFTIICVILMSGWQLFEKGAQFWSVFLIVKNLYLYSLIWKAEMNKYSICSFTIQLATVTGSGPGWTRRSELGPVLPWGWQRCKYFRFHLEAGIGSKVRTWTQAFW